MKDLLWSDIDANSTGAIASPRGAGCVFGPDVAQEWLEEEGLRHLIRSHYCIPQGIDKVPCDAEASGGGEGRQVYTIFSCSNYVQSGNQGSVVTFKKRDGKANTTPSPLPPVDNSLASHPPPCLKSVADAPVSSCLCVPWCVQQGSSGRQAGRQTG